MAGARLARPGGSLRHPSDPGSDDFYRSPEWRALAAAVKVSRGYRCEACGADMSGNRRACIADHVEERRDGGADLDPANMRVLCLACHNRKTAGARADRAARSGI